MEGRVYFHLGEHFRDRRPPPGVPCGADPKAEKDRGRKEGGTAEMTILGRETYITYIWDRLWPQGGPPGLCRDDGAVCGGRGNPNGLFAPGAGRKF